MSEADIAVGLDAAAAVATTASMMRFQGEVQPESWTHGSAAQRQQWFLVGYQTGDMERYDTSFSADLGASAGADTSRSDMRRGPAV